jgi:hypothetical protein
VGAAVIAGIVIGFFAAAFLFVIVGLIMWEYHL